MSHFRIGVLVVVGILGATVADAQVVQSVGSGSAVSTVDASADFESTSALYGNPYLENGISFTRTNLSFNNNGCGYAGCASHLGFAGFSGNYMYGTGTGGFFSMFAGGGQLFSGLEFMVGTGFGGYSTTNVFWQAFLSGSMVASGSTNAAVGTVVGFSSASGFDELRYTDSFTNFGAPAFDQVKAQYGTSTVTPEPVSMALLGTGLAGLAGVARRRRREREGAPEA